MTADNASEAGVRTGREPFNKHISCGGAEGDIRPKCKLSEGDTKRAFAGVTDRHEPLPTAVKIAENVLNVTILFGLTDCRSKSSSTRRRVENEVSKSAIRSPDSIGSFSAFFRANS